jgi:hypothetical protein
MEGPNMAKSARRKGVNPDWLDAELKALPDLDIGFDLDLPGLDFDPAELDALLGLGDELPDLGLGFDLEALDKEPSNCFLRHPKKRARARHGERGRGHRKIKTGMRRENQNRKAMPSAGQWQRRTMQAAWRQKHGAKDPRRKGALTRCFASRCLIIFCGKNPGAWCSSPQHGPHRSGVHAGIHAQRARKLALRFALVRKMVAHQTGVVNHAHHGVRHERQP